MQKDIQKEELHKMKQKVIYLIIALVFLSAVATVASANPMAARIYFTKATELAVPAAYTFRFSIWDVATGGTKVTNRVWWEEKDLAMTDKNLSTYLGDVADPAKRSGPLGELDFSEQYWVLVEKLAPDGLTYKALGGRARLTVVPYAMWSETSGSGSSVRSVTAGSGLTASDADGDITLNIGAGPGISVWADKIAIATGAVSSSMLAAGAVTSGKIAAGAVDNTHLANGAVTFSKIGTACPDGYYPKYSSGAGWICGVGTPGADGRTILSGASNPTGSVGKDGDFYINKTTTTLFGPKSGGTWPPGVPLIGPPVNTTATCSSAVSPYNGDCTCSHTTISKVTTYNTCTATSDTGSCTAVGITGSTPRYGSCCVCTY